MSFQGFPRGPLIRGAWVAFGVAFLASGCGYTLQSSQYSSSLEKDGIRKIFIAPVVNNTYRSGVENIVYNALVRSLSVFHGIKLVGDREQADAILNGSVSGADYTVNASVNVVNLNPSQLNPNPATAPNTLITRYGDEAVVSQYLANLSCAFSLSRATPAVKTQKGAGSEGGGLNGPLDGPLNGSGNVIAIYNSGPPMPGPLPPAAAGAQPPTPPPGLIQPPETGPRKPVVKSPAIWSAAFVRQVPFTAANQLGILGDTSGLINDSEFDRTLAQEAQDMMQDVREGIVGRF